MKSQTCELLNVRVGSMKYKHVLLIDLAFIAFTTYLYRNHADNLFFLFLIALNVGLAAFHYRAAKRQLSK
jgi:hypothetical protein